MAVLQPQQALLWSNPATVAQLMAGDAAAAAAAAAATTCDDHCAGDHTAAALNNTSGAAQHVFATARAQLMVLKPVALRPATTVAAAAASRCNSPAVATVVPSEHVPTLMLEPSGAQLLEAAPHKLLFSMHARAHPDVQARSPCRYTVAAGQDCPPPRPSKVASLTTPDAALSAAPSVALPASLHSGAPASSGTENNRAPAQSAGDAGGEAAGAAPSRAAVGVTGASTELLGPMPWLYALVECDFLFKPCPACSSAHNGREVLLTYYDLDDPTRGYCGYCPERASRRRLLQIRRSTYHEVVKAGDLARLTDVMGVQHYVINGSKVVFLRPRPQPRPPKGVVAPARCVVDGRQLMDYGSRYCSLRCKLEAEDPVFAERCGATGGGAAAATGTGTDGSSSLAGTAAPAQAGAAHKPVVAPRRPLAKRSLATGEEVPSVVGPRSKRRAAVAALSIVTGMLGLSSHEALEGAPSPHGGHERMPTTLDGSDGPVAARGEAMAGLLCGEEPAAEAIPTASGESGLSSTCNYRWQHRRKGEPCRAPLQ